MNEDIVSQIEKHLQTLASKIAAQEQVLKMLATYIYDRTISS